MTGLHSVRQHLGATRLRGTVSFWLDRPRWITRWIRLKYASLNWRNLSRALRLVSLEQDACERDRWPMIACVPLLIARVQSECSKLSGHVRLRQEALPAHYGPHAELARIDE